ncbi:hypothetical protein ABG768_019106 [Culter alburnus]|uniref:Uncharacterized protein n=1 Tax=Culter alburnus TaxID=194366 RepID=A0AAW2AU43_CULAL
MSGKRQLSILSFTLRGKPPKKARLQDAGPEKVAKRVGPLEEETEEETVQVEEEETVEEMAGLEPNCFKWEPTPQMIKESKKATNTYNKLVKIWLNCVQ